MDKSDIIISMLSELRQDLNKARQDASEEAKALHGRITKLDVSGCSLAGGHKTVQDKVAEHERIIQQGRGAIWAMMGLSGVAGGLSGFFASLFKGGPHP